MKTMATVHEAEAEATDYVVYRKDHSSPYDRQGWLEYVYHKPDCSALKRIAPHNQHRIQPVRKGDKVELVSGTACKTCGVDKHDIWDQAKVTKP